MAAVRYTVADGGVVMVEVIEAVADAIGRLDRSEARKERKRKRHERCFSDLRGRDGRDGGPDGIEVLVDGERLPSSYRVVATSWSGPRFPFDHVLGVNLTGWSPRVELSRPCVVCRGGHLDANCCCLACGRTGRDHMLPRPTAAERQANERALRAAKAASDGLEGGKGGRPKPKPPKTTTRGRAR